MPENNARQGFFERTEFEAVVARLPRYLADMARFAYRPATSNGPPLERVHVVRDAAPPTSPANLVPLVRSAT